MYVMDHAAAVRAASIALSSVCGLRGAPRAAAHGWRDDVDQSTADPTAGAAWGCFPWNLGLP